MPITQCTAQQLQERLQRGDKLLLLDVREAHEYAFAHVDGSIHIPLNRIPERIQELNNEQDIVAICHHGMRSQQACLFLEQYGFDRLYNLKGGIDAWSVSCDPTVPRY
ncbi:rhodanese-like domain-containing protein [Methylomonas rivi]|uniref:Rhodanese-like domain-containing protein n=1 Tax=Methylomonas rivi TaxID=2952226 RepID=A0ABT1TZZ7_9GAMM|nr:rhodanese-like domain-containing protein [Methylomonas sp. WSC-6]MBS4050607.1 rhodanese [Methylomonas sp.]MCQ8127134.1 rhodanese-like domain-containing protein [Methylomonas sp. WSC-6]